MNGGSVAQALRGRRWVIVLCVVIVCLVLVAGGIGVGLMTGRSVAADRVFVQDHLDGVDRAALVHVTPGAGQGSPIVYLFPGRGGDETQWFAGHPFADGVGIDLIADQLVAAGVLRPLTVVSADLCDTYGVDSAATSEGYEHGQLERYIVDDLLPTVESRYGTPSERWVGGVSMGGFAALHVAFRHPELFDAVIALSPAIFQGTIADRMWLFDGDGGRPAHDPLELAETAPIDHLRIGLGAGLSDYSWIKDATTHLGAILIRRSIDHTLDFTEGGHNAGPGSAWHLSCCATWYLPTRPELSGPSRDVRAGSARPLSGYEDALAMTESITTTALVDPTDEALARAAVDDVAQFARLYERHRLRVYRYLRALGATDDQALDVTAITFERALRSLPGYRPRGGGFVAWLLRIARNAHIDGVRRDRHEVDLAAAETVAAETPDLADHAALRGLVSALPEETRHAIALSYAAGLSARDIGQVLGKRPVTVQQLIERGLHSLREAFHGDIDA